MIETALFWSLTLIIIMVLVLKCELGPDLTANSIYHQREV